MEDDSNGKIRPSDFIEDDGTLQGVIRQIEEIIKVFSELNAAVKKEDFTKWLNNVAKGSNEEKVAIQALTTLAERLLALEQKLVEVRAEESKELARLNQMVKDENRDKAKEAEINSKVAGSYARMKLELQQLVEQYKNTTDASQKSKLADGIILLSNELMLADKELKNLMNDYTKLSATEQARLATLERERAASEAAAESIKKRAKAEAELNEVTKNRGAVESTALAEQMRKAIEERIQLEAKELMLQDQFYAKELSSAEMIKQRLAIKEQLTQTEAKLKALEMQEANDLAIVKARVTMKQQQLDVEAKIIAAESQEGRNLAENEAKLKRIQQQNERNAQIATAVAGSYEHMKLTLQAKLDVLNNVNRSQGVAFSNALAEVAAAQQQVTEAEAWLNIVKQQANEQVKLNLLSDQEYQSMVQKNKELALEIKYTQGVVDSRAKLAAIQQVATTYNANGQSQLEEIKYNEELAASIKRVADLRAKAAVVATQEYKDQLQAQNDLKKARLQAVADINVESATAKELASGTYAQLEARYNLLVMQIEELDNSTDDYSQTLQKLRDKLDGVASALETYDKAAGKSSNRMSTRQREWNGLTNSVYQLSRELPNLAVRVDTFFLAISNNIPIFIDEFKRARKELGSFRSALAETGKAFLKSIPLAALLLILSKWSEWVVPTFDKIFGTLEDGTLKVGRAYKNLAKEVEKVNDSFGEHMASLMMLSERWKKLDSVADKEEFLAKYREELDRTGLAIETVNDGEKAFVENTGLIIQAFIQRAKAAAAMSLAQKEYVKYVNKMVEVDRKVAKEVNKQTGQPIDRDAIIEAAVKAIPGAKLLPNGDIVLSGALSDSEVNEIKVKVDVGSGIRSSYTDREGNVHYTSASGANTKYGAEFAGTMQRYYQDYFTNGVAGQPLPEELVYAIGLSTLDVNYSDVRKTIKSIEEANVALRQGNEYVKMGIGYKDAEQGLYEMAEVTGIAGKGVKDLTKKINDMELAAMKFLHDRTLGAMGNTYERRFKEIEEEFDEYIKQADNKIKEIDKLLSRSDLSPKLRSKLEDIKTWYETASTLAEKERKQRNSDLKKEEYVDQLNALKDNIDNRLAATKEGSDEEIALRRKSIQKAMQIEIAENAKLEAKLQRSVSAIRAKYRREEEKAEREWLIKKNNWLKQQLENENASEISLTLDYYNRRRAIQQIELENELLENAELIENGQIKREDIIRKHLKAQENLWKEHRNAVLSSQKSMWDVVEELAQTDSYEQLAAQLNKYDIELEQTKLQQQEIIDFQIPQELERIATERANLVKQLEDQTDLTDEEIELINKQIEGLDDEAAKYEVLSQEIADYIQLLTRLNEKRKANAEANLNLRNFEKTQEIESIGFYSQFQVGERQGAAFELEQERKLLEYRRDNAVALGYSENEIELINAQLADTIRKERELKGWRGTISSVANHGIAGLVQLPAKDANGQMIKDEKTGKPVLKDLSADQYDTLSTVYDSIKESLDSIIQGYIDVAQAAYDAAQAQVDAARTVYEAELEARANGYANDVEGAKRELALEKRKAKQKEQILKQAQKTQERINTLQQISSLITGSAQILETFAAYPVIAAILLASMWGMFAAAKIQAAQLANQSSTYGGGGFEVAVGGSHASGHDIKTGIKTKSGSQMVIEGGEGVGVFSRKAVTKYGDIIPNLVDSINSGTYDDVGNSQGSLDRLSPAVTYGNMDFESAEPLVRTEYAKEIMAMQTITNATDLSTIEGMLRMIVKQQDNQQIVLSDGSIMERKGNKTTITRRG